MRRAELEEDENSSFRGWLKHRCGLDDVALMAIVRRLAEEATARIDCTACANCCRVRRPVLDEGDMGRLAQALGVDIAALRAEWLTQDPDGGWQLPAPCPLLEGTLCRVYDARPSVCREYPHLHNDFRRHSLARVSDSLVCPIVFDVIEGMKVELGWRYGRRHHGCEPCPAAR